MHFSKNRAILYLVHTSGDVAQLGERSVRIREVESSILFVSTMTHTTSCRICMNAEGQSAKRPAVFFSFPNFVFGAVRKKSRGADCPRRKIVYNTLYWNEFTGEGHADAGRGNHPAGGADEVV